MAATDTGQRLTRVCTLRGHDERVWCVAWRPGADPPQLATSGADRNIRLWGARRGCALDSEDAWGLLAEVDTSDRHTRTMRSISWNAGGDIFAAACFDATTSLWQEIKDDGEEGPSEGIRFESVGLVTGHENEVKCTAFSPSGEFMATCSRDKSVWIYDTQVGGFDYDTVALLQSHTQDVKMVKWHPSQDILFSCSYDDTIKVWGPDGDDWSCKETLEGHRSTVWGISFDAEGSRFASCSDDRTVRVWAPASKDSNGLPHKVPSKPAGSLLIAAHAFVSPLFRQGSVVANTPVATPSSDGKFAPPSREARRRVPPADASCSWTCVAELSGHHPRPVYSVDWLPFGLGTTTAASTSSSTVFATACGDNHVRIFQADDEVSLKRWSCVADVEAHDGDANAVAWCPQPLADGRGALLASVGDDAEVTLWRYS